MSEAKAFNGGATWTKEDLESANRMLREGVSLKEMCEKLGRTASGVIGKLEKEGHLVVMKNGHYYVMPEVPRFMWQEVKEVDALMRSL